MTLSPTPAGMGAVTSGYDGLSTPALGAPQQKRPAPQRPVPQDNVIAQFIKFLQQQAGQNQTLQREKMADARNTGGRHLGMSGEDITNGASNPFAAGGFFKPRAEREGLQSLAPSGDFRLLTEAGRAPSAPPAGPVPIPMPQDFQPAPMDAPRISLGPAPANYWSPIATPPVTLPYNPNAVKAAFGAVPPAAAQAGRWMPL